MTSDVINRGPGFQIFKGKKFSNYVNKSSILNVPRVATRFTDITTTTTTTTDNNNDYYNKNNKNNTNKNNNDKKNKTAYLLREKKTSSYTVENIYCNTCN